MNPPLSSVGLTERDALAAGHTIKVAAKPVAAIAAMPRAKTLENPRGIMKFVIDAETDQILGRSAVGGRVYGGYQPGGPGDALRHHRLTAT